MTEPNTNSEQNAQSGASMPTFDDVEIDRQEWANCMVVTAKHAGICTVEELLAVAQIDTDVWEVCGKPHLNKWSVAAKAKDSHLLYDEGKVTGEIEEHGLVVAPMFQVKITLVRKRPVFVYPTISPVDFDVSYCKPSIPDSKNTRRALVLGDAQMGYRRDSTTGSLTPLHDRQVLDLALQVAVDTQVDNVFFCGDMLDLTEWSDKFLKGPSFYQTTQPALFELAWWLRRYRQDLPEATIKIKLGNHEARMQSAMIKHLPAACDLRVADLDVSFDNILPQLSLSRLLALDQLGVDYDGASPASVEWINNRLFGILHGNIAKVTPGATSRAYLDKFGAQVVFFHIHRPEMVSATIHFADKTITAWAGCPGCACHVDGRVPGAYSESRWVQGFGIVDYSMVSDFANMQTILIRDGQALFNGKQYTARDPLADLRSDLPDWHFAE